MLFARRKKQAAEDSLLSTERPEQKERSKRQGSGEYSQAGFTFETARICFLERSERNAWRCAGAFALATMLCTAAIFMMLPLKERIPYVVEVEKTTGTAQVLLPIGKEKAVPQSELMDKHFIARYVRCREGYDNRTVAGDFEVVRYLSMPNVFEPYRRQFKRNNSRNPDEKYGERLSVRIELTSVSVNTATDSATVRYVRRVVSNLTGRPAETSYRIATIGFEYFPDYQRSEKELLENPLGFKVTSFRTDQEFNARGLAVQPDIPSAGKDPGAEARPSQIIVIDPNNKEEAGKYLPEGLRQEVEKNILIPELNNIPQEKK